LKGFNDELHKSYCGGSIKPIIDNIIEFYKKGIHIEVTTLIVPGYNDNIEELSKIADFLANLDINIPWHITRIYPAWKMIDIEPTDINLMKKVKKVAIDKGLLNVHLGNI
jgi:pyruvate formate lyase activating enzyme